MALVAVGCLSAPPDGTGTPDEQLDAAPADAANLQLVEEMEVPTDCSVQSSDNVLAAGVTYRLAVSGVVTVGDELEADADYFWNQNDPGDIRDTSSDVDLGVAIDAQFHDTACGNNSGVLTLEILVLPG